MQTGGYEINTFLQKNIQDLQLHINEIYNVGVIYVK
jgi:hypothetical protein